MKYGHLSNYGESYYEAVKGINVALCTLNRKPTGSDQLRQLPYVIIGQQSLTLFMALFTVSVHTLPTGLLQRCTDRNSRYACLQELCVALVVNVLS